MVGAALAQQLPVSRTAATIVAEGFSWAAKQDRPMAQVRDGRGHRAL